MRELLFQKLWQGCCFDTRYLTTSCARPVSILHPGEINMGDGPDFSQASVLLDGTIRLYGHVELHVRNNEWYTHKHHKDPRYNTVILHVVLQPDKAEPVQREDGTFVPTLVLGSHISEQWKNFLRRVQHGENLRCAGIIHDIGPDVIQHQLDEASILYFAEKRSHLLQFFDADRPLSEACTNMVFLGWCDGLGIPANRAMMIEMGEYMIDLHEKGHSSASILNNALRFSGLTHSPGPSSARSFKRIEWDLSGCRPGNDPIKRIRQAAYVLEMLKSTPFKEIATQSGDAFTERFNHFQTAGTQRRQILRQIVLLPALYLLGEWIHRPQLRTFAEQQWKSGQIPTPKSHLKLVQTDSTLSRIANGHPGIIHQIKKNCIPGNCTDCRIFKNATGG